MSSKKPHNQDHALNTRLVHAGRDPSQYFGVVNPPLARTSSIIYPDLASYENPSHKYRYGRMGNPMSDAFEGAMAELEGGAGAVGTQTGVSAITTAILSFVKSGDHILIVDTVYPPLRDFCANVLARMNVETQYYDPMIGAGIKDLMRENTALIYLESPGSGTFEVQDTPAIAKLAKENGVVTIADNTYAAGVLFNPIKHGVDVALQSCTKYVGGHSDINLGVIVCATEEQVKKVRRTANDLGVAPSQDDMALALRGLRTLTLRMRNNAASAAIVAQWMRGRPEIERVYYPAFEGHAGHEFWKRDFSGANGLFSFLLKPVPVEKVHAFIDTLQLFPIASSWGGYESLLQPQYPNKYRGALPWMEEGRLFRFQIGMEDPKDLIADIEQAFTRLS